MIIATGLSGFVGRNLSNYFDKLNVNIQQIKRENLDKGDFDFSEEVKVVIHLAGKAHDTKNTLNPQEYYYINTELTKKVYDAFLDSKAKVFITLSSVKAVADFTDSELTEENSPNPFTHYGKSKLFAEEYILSKEIKFDKRVYILRPCMIHGPGNKGNLSLLYNLVSKGIPWPLGAFDNKRSFCSIENLLFIINELIKGDNIPSGVYNIADDKPIATNTLITLIGESLNRNPKIWKIPKSLINFLALLGDILHLPINSERLRKLTESFVVSNNKIKSAIGKPLPTSSEEGLIKTFKSFK
jgi:nucleoside-diphosphate-sugar epimerase